MWVARGKELLRCNYKRQCLRWGPKEGKSCRGEAACEVSLCACFLVAFCSLEQEQPVGSGHPPPGSGLKLSFDSVDTLLTSEGLFKVHTCCKLLNLLVAHCRLGLQLPFPYWKAKQQSWLCWWFWQCCFIRVSTSSVTVQVLDSHSDHWEC